MTLEERLESVPEALAQYEFLSVIDTIYELVGQANLVAEIQPGWYVYLGIAQYFSSRFEDAISSYSLAIKLDAKNLPANMNLAYLLACCPDPFYHNAKFAIKHAKRGCRITHWKEWHGPQNLATAYARSGNFKAADRYVQKAYKLAPANLQWRVTRLIECFRKEEPYTACLEDDKRKLSDDWDRTSK